MKDRIPMLAIGALVLVLALGALWFVMNQQGHKTAQPAQVPAASENAVIDPTLPTFDIVRVDRRGTAVMAGHAVPLASVRILVGGKKVAEPTATARGEWVASIDEPLEPGSQEITLEATNPDGSIKRSVQTVVVVVPPRNAPGDEPPLVVLSQAGQASRILQGPPGEVGAGGLTLDSVDYNEAGNLILSGKAKAGTLIRPYLDGKLLGEVSAGSDGRWKLSPKASVKPGTYTLRVDEVDETGKVAQRIELPFERASASALQAGSMVVQPGNSLWRIARHAYGEGTAFATIYKANQEAIKDPNLIYPGQVLNLPSH